MYEETKRLGGEITLGIGFYRHCEEWVKTTSSRNEDTLITSKDDRMLNDIYPTNQLLNFKLRARSRVPCRAIAA